MVTFETRSQRQGHDLHAAAFAAGRIDEGQPGFRDAHGPQIQVAYLRDFQGNKIALFSSNPGATDKADSTSARNDQSVNLDSRSDV